MDRTIENLWEMGLTRSDVITSKFAGGDVPEPLTDYMDVSWCSWCFVGTCHGYSIYSGEMFYLQQGQKFMGNQACPCPLTVHVQITPGTIIIW